MKYTDDKSTASDFAAKALSALEEHGLAANPRNFEIWFSYYSNQNRDFVKAVNSHIQGQTIALPETLEELHHEFLSRGQINDSMFDLSGNMLKELESVANMVSSAGADTTEYSETLHGMSGALKKDGASAAAILENLLTATSRMEARTRQLENNLQASAQEIDRLKTNLNTIRQEALIDDLTQVANRRQFDSKLREAIGAARDHGEAVSLIICDIDHFKSINDTYGHQTGDQILRLISSCLRDAVGDGDTAARYGGEEFALVLRNKALSEARDIAENLRQTVESRRVVKRSTGEDLGKITISLGGAQCKQDDTPESLIERSDCCLYDAKRTGRNRVVMEGDAPAPARAANA